MNLEGVNAPNGYAYGLQKAQADEPDGSQAAAVEPVNSKPPESDNQETKGVIRLLQEGHFKGVADVRLRINFFDELAGIEAGELKAAAEGQIDAVLGVVEAAAEPVAVVGEPAGDEGGSLQGLQDEFAAAVNDAKEEFMGAEIPSKDGLVGALNAAFGAFVEGLWELFGPGPEVMEEEAPLGEGEGAEAGAEGAAGGGEQTSETQGVGEESGVLSEPAPETAPAPSTAEVLENYIAGLEAAFEATMGDLLGALDGVVVLPELSEPSGNGVAYDKFLAIYNEMRGLEVGGQDSDGTGAVDATV